MNRQLGTILALFVVAGGGAAAGVVMASTPDTSAPMVPHAVVMDTAGSGADPVGVKPEESVPAPAVAKAPVPAPVGTPGVVHKPDPQETPAQSADRAEKAARRSEAAADRAEAVPVVLPAPSASGNVPPATPKPTPVPTPTPNYDQPPGPWQKGGMPSSMNLTPTPTPTPPPVS